MDVKHSTFYAIAPAPIFLPARNSSELSEHRLKSKIGLESCKKTKPLKMSVVVILISGYYIAFSLKKVIRDRKVHFLIFNVYLYQDEITLPNIFAPNERQAI